MTRNHTLVVLMASGVLLVAGAGVSLGQTCQAGQTPSGPAYPGQVAPWSKHFTALTRLGDQRITLGDDDSMTEPLWLTAGAVSPYNGTGFRETWYIPRDALGGTAGFFRLYSGTYADHMDAPTSTEAYPAYQSEFTHGYPWTSQQAGTQPLTRYFNGAVFNHVTYLADLTIPHGPAVEGTGYSVDAVYSTASATPRYGYQRFNTCLGDSGSPFSGSGLDLGQTLANGTLSIHFNRVWGNAIDAVTYLHSTPGFPAGSRQIIDPAIGSMLQTVIRGAIACSPCTNGFDGGISPGEAGGAAAASQYNLTTLYAGSPILSVTSTSSSVQTELKPLSFEFDLAPAGEPGNSSSQTNVYTPLMWRGSFLRTTTLGYTVGATTYPGVVKLGFQAKLDADAPSDMDEQYNLNHTAFMPENMISTSQDYSVELYAVFNWRLLQVAPPGRTGGCTGECYVQYTAGEDEAWVIRTNDNSFAIGLLAPFSLSDAQLVLQSLYHFDAGHGHEWVFDTFRIVPQYGVNRVSYKAADAFFVVGSLDDVRTGLTQVLCQEKGRCTTARQFYWLPPCRVVDTRWSAGTYGGPALNANAVRTFPMAQQCGIPSTATALAVNVTTTGPTASGNLVVFPAGINPPTPIPTVQSHPGVLCTNLSTNPPGLDCLNPAGTTFSLNYAAGRTRAGNSTIEIWPSGQLSIVAAQPSGTTHAIIDVTGYYQ